MKCKACKKEIVFLKTASNKWEPVNASSLSDDDLVKLANHSQVLFDHTRHVSHFSDCPGAAEFRKPKNQMELL